MGKNLSDILNMFQRVQVYALVGESGTGKSYQATALAQRKGFEAIIDDGLLIYKGQIVAGTSAKKCTTKAAAMRAALFNVAEQREEVIKAIEEHKPKALMIIGTSDRMTDIIADQLGFGPIEERIYIEDVSTEEDRMLTNTVFMPKSRPTNTKPTMSSSMLMAKL